MCKTKKDTFSIDLKTLADLEIFTDDTGRKSIFEMMDFTQTSESKELLKTFFKSPESSSDRIISVQECLKTICLNLDDWNLHLNDALIEGIKSYLRLNIIPISSTNPVLILLKSNSYKSEYRHLERGVIYIHQFLQIVIKFFSKTKKMIPAVLSNEFLLITDFLNNNDIQHFTGLDLQKNRSEFIIFKYDKILREQLKTSLEKIIEVVCILDMYLSLSKSIAIHGFVFPRLVFSKDTTIPISINGLYHPFVKNPIKNDILFSSEKNVLFLTGPNMGGKSTFMKACGIALYFAHLGFGVPARSMEFCLLDTLISAIDTTDTIQLGYSYFYNEIRRIKDIGQEFKHRKKMFIIIDEMFKGTNIKDAYDCSLQVIERFCKSHSSFMIVSSHLTELEADIACIPNIFFKHFDVVLVDNTTKYTYTLEDGISHTRLGLQILKQEGVLDLFTISD